MQPARVFSLDPEFREQPAARQRYPFGWAPLRARILTRMSDASVGSFMYTIQRRDTGQSCTLLAFDAFDALLKFHGRSFSGRYQCDQIDGKLRARHKDTGIEYIISSVVPYFSEDPGSD